MHTILELFLTAAEKTFLCLGMKLNYTLVSWFLTRWENLHHENLKWITFLKSYVNSNPDIYVFINTVSKLVKYETQSHRKFVVFPCFSFIWIYNMYILYIWYISYIIYIYIYIYILLCKRFVKSQNVINVLFSLFINNIYYIYIL